MRNETMKIKTMLTKLYMLPIVLLALSILLSFIFSPLFNSNSAITKSLHLPIQYFLYALLFASLLTTLFSTYRFIMWTKGKGELCKFCGGILQYRFKARYSPHYRCLACGKNENAMKRHYG